MELFYEDFESATIGLTATMPYSYLPGPDSPWQVKTSTYQPTTTDAWKPATNSGAIDNLFGFTTSDYFQAKIQTQYNTTSSFNTTDFVSLTLDFSMYFSHYGRSGEDFRVQISDDGATWNDLAIYTTDQGYASLFKTMSISVPDTYLDKTTVSIRLSFFKSALYSIRAGVEVSSFLNVVSKTLPLHKTLSDIIIPPVFNLSIMTLK